MTRARKTRFTGDSYQNFAANVGYGANNLSAGSQYGFNPITRNRVQLDYMYRGSWIVQQVVDSVADDMTRAGIDFNSDMPPDNKDAFHKHLQELQIWQRLNATIKWSRLYGGAVAVMMIDGQRVDTPFRMDTIGRGSFKGLLVLDRWMLQPYSDEVVTNLGADFGDPKYYTVVSDARSLPNMKIHHSRVVRFDGVQLPYWQRMTENGWGLSVIEPIYDRLVAFDSATVGTAQLVYRAYLRTYKVENLREILAAGGKAKIALIEQMKFMRLAQSNEGLTLMDSKDEYEAHAYAFGGLSEVLMTLGQQLSGGVQIPLTRLFGQSPAGMNATGESDMRNYYDGINAKQEARLRLPLTTILHVAYMSRFGQRLPEGFDFTFNSLWQMTEMEKAQVAAEVTGAVDQAVTSGVINPVIALKELRDIGRLTGVFSNITDEDIDTAEAMPPDLGELGPPGMPAPAGGPGQAGAASGVAPHGAAPAARPPSPGTGPHPPAPPRPGSKIGESVLLHEGPHHAILSDDNASVARQLARDTNTIPIREFQGMDIVIESPKGDRRVGYGWANQMPADYGYFRGTRSQEGSMEQMDCYIGPNPDAPDAWIIYQHDPATGMFDEHKVMLGFDSEADARKCYYDGFEDGSGSERCKSVRKLSVPALKEWLKTWKFGQNEPGLRVARAK